MSITQIAAKYLSEKKERSLVGIGSESFQFLPIYLTLDVPETEIGDSIARVNLLQQSSFTQDSHTVPSMNFTDIDVPTSRTRRASKFPVQVASIETHQCSVSRMKPRRKRQGVSVGPRYHTNDHTLPGYKTTIPSPVYACVG